MDADEASLKGNAWYLSRSLKKLVYIQTRTCSWLYEYKRPITVIARRSMIMVDRAIDDSIGEQDKKIWSIVLCLA